MVKRYRASTINWAQAVKNAMASSRGLKTQTALSKKSGVAQSTIGRILRGEVNPQAINLEMIAKAFGMSLARLLEIALEVGPLPEPLGLAPVAEPEPEPVETVALISWVQEDSFGLILVSGPSESVKK